MSTWRQKKRLYTQKPRPGLVLEKAKAVSSQAEAGAFRPSRAGTSLIRTPEELFKSEKVWVGKVFRERRKCVHVKQQQLEMPSGEASDQETYSA